MSKQANSRNKRPRLGRGLSSLVINSADIASDERYQAEKTTDSSPKSTIELKTDPALAINNIPVDQITKNPYQPRTEFSEEELKQLADSISQQGILQPLVVSAAESDSAEKPFTLIAGERRLRAATMAGLETVPAVIKTATKQQMLEWALIENIQREDLNPIERAVAYRQYVDRFKLTHAQAAEKLGQPRATVSNYMRLLELEAAVQQMMAEGELTFGHGKVLAGIIGQPARQVALAKCVLKDQLSVRALEQLVEAGVVIEEVEEVSSTLKTRPKAPHILDLENQLSQAIGTRVIIRSNRKKHSGKIVIEYYNLDDFDRITGSLGVSLES